MDRKTDSIIDVTPTSRLDDARAFDGVLTRRVVAFFIDYLIIGLLMIPVAIVIAILGVVTLGLGWFLYPVIGLVVALPYVALTMGGPSQSTVGMRMMDLRMERLDGKPVDPLLAVVHTVLFWALNSVLTPLVLLATLFLDGKRTLHDLMLGTVVVRAS